jgi:hypothetical protein
MSGQFLGRLIDRGTCLGHHGGPLTQRLLDRPPGLFNQRLLTVYDLQQSLHSVRRVKNVLGCRNVFVRHKMLEQRFACNRIAS